MKLKLLFMFIVLIFSCFNAFSDTTNQLFIPATQDDVIKFDEKFADHPNPLVKNRLVKAQNNPVAIRSEIVKINFDYINTLSMSKEYRVPANLNLNIFGKTYRAKLKKINSYAPQNYSWIGDINSNQANLVVLTFNNTFLAGQVNFEGKTFVIKPLDETLHTLYETTDSLGAEKHIELLKTMPTPEADKYLSEEQLKRIPNMPDSSRYYIDLMVAYTDDTLAASGSVTTEIQNDVAYGNQVLANSCANFRLQLVDSFLVTYDETSVSNTDLSRLANTADGSSLAANSNLNTVTTRRDVSTVNADLVQIWVESSDVCGLAYAPSTPSSMGASTGFSLKLRTCSSTTFIHELGHNLGLAHDRYVMEQGRNTVTDYDPGYGFVDSGHGITTIMSYPYKCSSAGITCSRIPYFSNPRISYGGSQLGRAGFEDAVTKINSTWAVAANYRTSSNTSYTPDLTGCQENSTKEDKASPCFIATATYGSPFHPYVNILRNFKNNFLMKSYFGRSFVHWYYQNSPPLADMIRTTPLLKLIFLVLLSPIILIAAFPYLSLFVLLAVLFLFLFLYSKRKIIHYISSFIFAMIFSSQLNAQISSPYLDFTEINLNPAVTIWKRAGGNIAAFYKIEEQKYLAKDKEFTKTEGKNFLINGSYNYVDIGAEAEYLPSASYSNQEKLYQTNSSYDETKSHRIIHLAYRLFPFISLGAGHKQETIELSGEKTELATIKVGGTLYLSNLIFIGGFYSKNDQTKTKTKDLTWSEQNIGVGLTSSRFGFPFRVEASYSRSPEVISKGTAPDASGMHPETTIISVGGDLQVNINSFNIGDVILGVYKSSETKKDVGGTLSKKSSPLKLTLLAISTSKQFSGGLSYMTKKVEHGNDSEEYSELSVKISLLF